MSVFDFRTTKEEDDSDTRPVVEPGQLYTDPEFGLHQAIPDQNIIREKYLAWRRPIDLKDLSPNPKLFSDGSSRFDIGQGSAGTCWFLSALTSVAEQPYLLREVVPEDAYPVGTSAYNGVFHARLWRFGQREDVYCDDFLPVRERPGYYKTLWGASSATDKNEYWVSLMEKALARHYGSYMAVEGGNAGESFLALTGGVAEVVDFEDDDAKPTKVFSRIRNALNSHALVTASVPGENHRKYGLIGNHAYTVTDTAEVNGVRLLRARNPWGKDEWSGSWSDGSSEWAGIPRSEDPRERKPKEDGEFWISLQDFMTYFDRTTICALTPDFDQDGVSDPLELCVQIYGEWRGETAAGFKEKLNNPRFMFTISDRASEAAVVIQLIQRVKNRKSDDLFLVRCDLYKVVGTSGVSPVLMELGEKTNNYANVHQCSFRFRLTPGQYLILPSTADPGKEKSFLLRVFSSVPVLDVRNVSRDVGVMDVKKGIFNGIQLGCVHAESGAWLRVARNAGGQVSHRATFASNPQFLLTLDQPTPVRISLCQVQQDPMKPIGFRLYPEGGDGPLDIDTLYRLYEQCVSDAEGGRDHFVAWWRVETTYLLNQGRYTLIAWLDEPEDEKFFSVVFQSQAPVGVRGYQTGM